MVIQTAQQALTALRQADADVVAFQKQVDIPSNPINTVNAMYGITNRILTDLLSELGNLEGMGPNDPLPAQDQAAIAEIKQEILDGRSVVGAAITAADWSLGGIFDSTVGEVENIVSQVGAPFHVNWTVAIIGIAAVIVFFIWVKVA